MQKPKRRLDPKAQADPGRHNQVLWNGIVVLFPATHVTDCDIKTTAGGWRENSVVKTTRCFCRERELWVLERSTHTAAYNPLLTPILGNLTPPGLFRHCMQMVYSLKHV